MNVGAQLNGTVPYAGLIMDSAGNLYGTAADGGAGGEGTVFEMTTAGGGFHQTTLHSFTSGTDGTSPFGPLTMDASGNLYGTTYNSSVGGISGGGIVFELSQTSPGVWQENILYDFVNPTYGSNPYSGVTLDPDGNLYGTTYWGGASGAGVVYEVTAVASR
jgi:uncharacterized repeat protein (TIGR03803 family)